MKTKRATEKPQGPTGTQKSVRDMIRNSTPELLEDFDKLSNTRSVARHLSRLRCKSGFTQADMAKKLGCTQSRISKLEVATNDEITLGEIRQYAEATKAIIDLRCGPPRTHVQSVKHHALQMRAHLLALLDIADGNDDHAIKEAIVNFNHEAIWNLLHIVTEVVEKAPKTSGDTRIEIEDDLPSAPQPKEDARKARQKSRALAKA